MIKCRLTNFWGSLIADRLMFLFNLEAQLQHNTWIFVLKTLIQTRNYFPLFSLKLFTCHFDLIINELKKKKNSLSPWRLKIGKCFDIFKLMNKKEFLACIYKAKGKYHVSFVTINQRSNSHMHPCYIEELILTDNMWL